METKPNLEDFEAGCCPGCGENLTEEEASQPVCRGCDARLDHELGAYLDFVDACRE